MSAKAIASTIVVLLSLFIAANGQADAPVPNEFLPLIAGIKSNPDLDSFGKVLDEGKKIAGNSRKAHAGDPHRLALSAYRYALFSKTLLDSYRDPAIFTAALESKQLPKYTRILSDSLDETRKALEDAITLLDDGKTGRGEELATLKFELADFYIEGNGRVRRESAWKSHMDQARLIQDLLGDSYLIRQSLYGDDNYKTLISLAHLANSYLLSADFEKALEAFTRFESGMTKRYGDANEGLIYALQVQATIRAMIGHDEAARLLSNRVSRIEGKEWDHNSSLLELAPRAKSLNYKGFARIGGVISVGGPVGIRPDGSVEEVVGVLSSQSFRMRSDLRERTYTSVSPSNQPPTLRLANSVAAIVTVGEDGKVTEVNAFVEDRKLKERVEKEVRKWEFRPFLLDEKPVRMRGLVYYNFR